MKKRKDLEKTPKAQHGNKQENWPQEAQDAYYDAEEAEALANADWGVVASSRRGGARNSFGREAVTRG